MIQRIVRLSFHPEKIEDFLKLYEIHLIGIKQFQACKKLVLLEEKSSNSIFFTHSEWDSEEALNNYRSTEYFRDIWTTIKPWFYERAQAWTLEKKEFEENG